MNFSIEKKEEINGKQQSTIVGYLIPNPFMI